MSLKRAQALNELYKRGQISEVIERTLDKLFAYEAATSREQLAQLEADLAEFEQRYGMGSEEFYT